MKFAVLFEDDAAAPADLRSRHMQAHLAFLEANAAAVLAAGPLFSEENLGAGGMWIVDAKSADAVHALVRADPFWPTGLRKSVRVLEWRQVFADSVRITR